MNKAPEELKIPKTSDSIVRAQDIFTAPKEDPKDKPVNTTTRMFALSKTLAEEESGSEEDSRSGTSTEGEGEPFILSHVTTAVREAVLQEAGGEELPFDWNRYSGWTLADVAAEFALHVERWGAVPAAAAALPDWTAAQAAWPRGGLPRAKKPEPAKEPAKAAEPVKAAEPAKTEPKPPAPIAASASKPDDKASATAAAAAASAQPRPAVPVPALVVAPSASVLPPVGAVPSALVPELDLNADVDYAALPVLPELPAEAPSIQQAKQYKNYMRLRYEWQRRNPDRELPKPVSGWYKDGKPSSSDPAVREATDKASEKLRAAMEQLKGALFLLSFLCFCAHLFLLCAAAKEGSLPVVKVSKGL